MPLTIRRPTSADTNQLEQLFQLTCIYVFTTRNPESFKIGDYAKSTEEDDVWIAEQGNIIVGFTSIYPRDNFIHNLFVYPDYQRKGIGSKLLQIAEQHLAKPMTLKVALDNPSACGFYERHGWKQVDICIDTDIDKYFLYSKEN